MQVIVALIVHGLMVFTIKVALSPWPTCGEKSRMISTYPQRGVTIKHPAEHQEAIQALRRYGFGEDAGADEAGVGGGMRVKVEAILGDFPGRFRILLGGLRAATPRPITIPSLNRRVQS